MFAVMLANEQIKEMSRAGVKLIIGEIINAAESPTGQLMIVNIHPWRKAGVSIGLIIEGFS